MAKVCQLFSGSSGNSILISSKGRNYLVDIGVSAKRCEQALLENNVAPQSVEAILITHEHSDHTSGLRVFSSRYHTPVYAPKHCISNMQSTGIINEKVNISAFDWHLELEGVSIKAFQQSHDSVDCVGYRFDFSGIEKKSISICTDTGYITDNAREITKGTDLIFIESNHEISMVEMGPYPYPLKKRILGPQGHLSNFACGEFIKELAKSGTKRFVLSHLSRENNMPDIARQTALSALAELGLKEGVDYRLYVSSPQGNRSIVL